MKTLAIIALSTASVLSSFGSSYALPLAPVGAGNGMQSNVIQIDDRGHNWKHEDYGEHTWHRHDHWHDNDHGYYHQDRYYGDRHYHHGNTAAVIGGVAAGAIIGSAIAPHRRHYED
jgi:hypothetical protein